MELEYLVGIDFGHGETTASVASLIADNDTNLDSGGRFGRLNIRDSNLADGKIRQSVIALSAEGYTYDNSDEGWPRYGFKAKIQGHPNQDAFACFVRGVYEDIIRNNSFLQINEDGDRNFELFIACPTQWSSNDKREYKAFVENAMGIEIAGIMNESDAAFFAKHDGINGSTLVVDYGSSTIDFTLMVDGRKADIDHLSSNLGASNIEQRLFSIFKRDYQALYETAMNTYVPVADRPEVDNWLELAIRKAKEDYYTGKGVNFSFTAIGLDRWFPTEGDRGGFSCRYGKPIDDLIADYMEAVCNSFEKVKDYLLNQHISLSGIILSGGACKMPWVAQKLQQVFGQGIKIIRDSNPAYVVSDGIAKYAYAQALCVGELLGALDGLDYERLFRNADKDATIQILKEELSLSAQNTNPLSVFANDKQDQTLIDLRRKLEPFLEQLPEIHQYRKSLTKAINGVIAPIVNSEIASAIQEIFRVSVSVTENEYVPEETIFFAALIVLDWGDMLQDTPWTELDKVRGLSDRRDRAQSVLKRLLVYAEKVAETGSYHRDGADAMPTIVEGLKNSVRQSAINTFLQNQVFDTTFKMN